MIAGRIQWPPLSFAGMSRMVASSVPPGNLYGACFSNLTAAMVESLTSAVMRAVWGATRKMRCRDTVLTLLVVGHQVDPRQACVYQALCALRRQLCKYPALAEVVRKCWHATVLEGERAPGPVGVIYTHV